MVKQFSIASLFIALYGVCTEQEISPIRAPQQEVERCDKTAFMRYMLARAAAAGHTLIEGNGQAGTLRWTFNGVMGSLIAEGGSAELRWDSSITELTIELAADVNLLDQFVDKVEGNSFSLTPKPGITLASYTPVVIRVLMPNGSQLPRPTSIGRGDRVVSFPQFAEQCGRGR